MEENKKGNQMPKLQKPKFNIYWIYLLIAVLLIGVQFMGTPDLSKKEIESRKNFREMLTKKHVKRIVVVKSSSGDQWAEVFVVPAQKKVYDKSKPSRFSQGGEFFLTYRFLTIEELEKDINELTPEMIITKESRQEWASDIFGWVIMIVIFVAIWMFLMRRMSGGGGPGGMFNIGKSRAQVFDKDKQVTVDFNHVAGLAEAKVEIMEIVDFLKNPKRYTDLGGKIPKGALLVGPPGTGKTLLAKAVAGEAKVPFFSLSGSDFVEMFVGVGASRVRDLFKQAKEKAPCIIFIDEIDAIGRARGKNLATGGNDERENTLNQLLTEMDGFGTNVGVIILGATNRAEILDKALLRAGRFDRQIHVELPDIDERKEIFKVHLKSLKIDSSFDLDFLSKQTPGFSGADIANACNEAALIAARRNKTAIEKQDFLDAVDRIVGGLEKKNKIISKDEKKVIAFHESGHASVSWLLEHAHPLIKVTIIPRGKALGAAWYLPEERQITTYEQLFDELTALLAGRASEEVFFGKVSTGALNDLERSTKQAYAMVVYYGLNKRIGNVSYFDSSGSADYSFTKPYSEETGKVIDEEISKLVEEAYQRAKELIAQNKELISKLAHRLLEKEVIFRDDLVEVFGKRPFDKEEFEIVEPIAKAELDTPLEPKKPIEGLTENSDMA